VTTSKQPHDQELDSLLERTSRTFALTIPLLPEPTCRSVTTAYLLFRIADTFEDATTWPAEERTQALGGFAALLHEPTDQAAATLASGWVSQPPHEHDGYVDLLAKTPIVMEVFRDLAPTSRSIIRRHVERTVRGMSGYVGRARKTRALALRDLHDLREYCYVVAGIVGEMLTELFVDDHPEIAPVGAYLRRRARFYGEGLQLTNILKDSLTDVVEGRSYLPRNVARERVFELARRDLELAEEYVNALQRVRAPRGLLAFNALPLLLAWATLDRVEERGPGAKLTRPEVFGIIANMDKALDGGEPITWRSQLVS
jgi:farnesyl-diphosphate farnesyltransferase